MTDEKFTRLRLGKRIFSGQYVYTEVLCDGSTPCAVSDTAMPDHRHWRTGRAVLVEDLFRELSEALAAAHGLIAANQLVLGEYSGTREVADVERRIRAALEGQ